MPWFDKITGFFELSYASTQNRLRVVDGRLQNEAGGPSYAVGQLEFTSLENLRSQALGCHVAGVQTFGTIVGDVRDLHADSENIGAVFQVASQFNLLEMVSPNIKPEQGVTRYSKDRTQGPACAIAAGAGTIWRNYLVPIGDQIGQTADRQLDGLADLRNVLAREIGVVPQALWRMQNGYALPSPESLASIERYLSGLAEVELDQLRALLRVGVHKDVGVTLAGAAPDAQVTQVYCSALPVSYSSCPPQDWKHFASLILEAAYEATVLAAVLNASAGGSKKLFLTRLGGGAFGNDDSWINAAILRALKCVSNFEIDVLLVSSRGQDAATCDLEAAWRLDHAV